MKILLWNLENFYLKSDKPTDFKTPGKPVEKVLAIEKIIAEHEPEIIACVEVGKVESLKYFSEQFLNQNYKAYILPGNSDREIELGFLVKKEFEYECSIYSHRDRSLNFNYPHEKNLPSHKFSRDVSELRLKKNKKLQMIYLLVHLKSKWDRDGFDFNGVMRREAEVKALTEIYTQYKNTYPHIPIIIGGDFNGNASLHQTESEFTSIYAQTDLNDALEICQFPLKERTTFIQFNREGLRQLLQLDYQFISPHLLHHLDKENTGIIRFKSPDNQSLIPFPERSFDRAILPSDHYPYLLTLKCLPLTS